MKKYMDEQIVRNIIERYDKLSKYRNMDFSLVKRRKDNVEVDIITYDGDCCSILCLHECPGLVSPPSHKYNKFKFLDEQIFLPEFDDRLKYKCRFFYNQELKYKRNETHTVPVRCDACNEHERKVKENMEDGAYVI